MAVYFKGWIRPESYMFIVVTDIVDNEQTIQINIIYFLLDLSLDLYISRFIYI